MPEQGNVAFNTIRSPLPDSHLSECHSTDTFAVFIISKR
jgi:hypothetical protein